MLPERHSDYLKKKKKIRKLENNKIFKYIFDLYYTWNTTAI